MQVFIEKIKELKEQKNAVILAHNYQVAEVQAIADYLGDSLDLSKLAAKSKQDIIVFAGVKFMAETAKILSPQKKVFLPRLDAGCPMADMITVEELLELKQQYPKAKVVAYVNSTVEIKAESDACCTSANAVKVVGSIDSNEIIFVPDWNLGSYVQKMVGKDKKLILTEGFCYVHDRIKKEEIIAMKQLYPEAKIVVHPETKMSVIEIADEVLSTSGMLKYVNASPAKQFIVGTEQGLIERMKRENPGKEFFPPMKPKICANMKKTGLIDVYNALEYEQYEIKIDESISKKAVKALNEMLKYI